MLRPPTLTLFPYTTLFRSVLAATDKGGLLLVGRMPHRYRGPVDTGRSRRPLPASGATGHGRCGGGIGVARVLLNQIGRASCRGGGGAGEWWVLMEAMGSVVRAA